MSRSVFGSNVMPGTMLPVVEPLVEARALKYMWAMTPIVWTPAFWRSFGKKTSLLVGAEEVAARARAPTGMRPPSRPPRLIEVYDDIE